MLAQAQVLAKFVKALKLDRPLVVGHSLGGGVSLALAERAPESVGGLALIAPFTHSVAEPPEPFLGLMIVSPLKRKIVAWTIATPLSMLNGKKALATVFSPERAPDDFKLRGGGMLTLRPSNFYAASADMMTANDDLPEMIRAYPSLTMPIGVLFARDDAILDYRSQGEALKRERPTTELVLLDGGGHMLPITAPDLCANFIRDMAKRTFAPAAN
jgi:pimeloyl-ACP methyl ester carboxylesterase